MRYGSFDQNRTMHKIKCSECGADAEVPLHQRKGAQFTAGTATAKKKPRY